MRVKKKILNLNDYILCRVEKTKTCVDLNAQKAALSRQSPPGGSLVFVA